MGPENPFRKYHSVISIPAGIARAFKSIHDSKRCLIFSQLALEFGPNYHMYDRPSLRLHSIHHLSRKLGIAYWKSGNLNKGLEISQKSVSLEEDGIGLKLDECVLRDGQKQRDQMQYKLDKLNGELEEEEDYSSDSEYDVPEGESADILEILGGKVHMEKLLEILSRPVNCDPDDYDAGILFQLLGFGVKLDTQEPESLEAELILKAFKSFIANGIDLRWSDRYRNTILHIAAKENQFLIVKFLLQYGARLDLDAVDFSGATPLACAVAEGSKESAKLLISAGAKLDFRASSTSPPLLFRALSTDIDISFLKFLLESGLKDTINEPHLHYGTILHHAAFTCPVSVIKVLLEYGADANALDYMRLTPLGLAITLGYAEGVVELLMPHTNTDLLDYRGRHLSMLRCQGDGVRKIRQTHPPQDRAQLNIMHSQLRRERANAEVLVYYWLRSQSYRPQGYVLEVPNQMFHIIMHARLDTFAVLIRGHEKALSVKKDGELRSDRCSDCGEEIDCKTSAFVCRRCCPTLFCGDCLQKDALTPTVGPRRRCLPKIDVKLADSECRPIMNGRGFQFRRVASNSIFRGTEKRFKEIHPEKYALWGLVQSGTLDRVKSYVEKLPASARTMVDIDTKDFTGYTILHFAAEEERDEIFTYLAEQGADLNASDIAGWSIAHSAATAARMTVLKYMAVEGANLNVQDAYGRTPLHAAVLEGNVETVKLLLHLGVDQDIIDEDCQRACDIPSIMPAIKQVLTKFRYANEMPDISNLSQDPTSESRRAVRTKKLDPSGFTIAASNVLAYPPQVALDI
ncbi:hypothetical protein TWF281_006855 [Arthrobotrys megalospora]